MLRNVPESTIQRLPLYLRCLIEFERERMPVISSVQLAEMCGTNAAQVRKDLSFLGELGTRGIGYDVDGLVSHISSVLGVTEQRTAALVGFGRLGGALLGYTGFPERGFEIVEAFDVDPAKVGTVVGGVTVASLDELESRLAARPVDIVIISTPASVAQAVTDRVVAVGVKAILNLAPTRLVVPDDVAVRHVCLSTDLQVLSFHLAQKPL